MGAPPPARGASGTGGWGAHPAPPHPPLFHLFHHFHLFPVPIDATQGLKMLYVFVDIKIDTSHFLETLRFNFAPGASLALVSTIQFVSAVQVSRRPAPSCLRSPDRVLYNNSDQCFMAAPPSPAPPGAAL